MSFNAVAAVLAIPAAAAALLALLPGYRLSARLNVVATLLTFLAALSLFFQRPPTGPYVLVDDLNTVFIVLTTFVGFTTSAFSASYIEHELETGRLTPAFLRFYHAMYQVLMFAMNLALVTNNIGVMWVGDRAGHADHRADGRHLPDARGARSRLEIFHSRQRRHRARFVRHHPHLYGGRAHDWRRPQCHGVDRSRRPRRELRPGAAQPRLRVSAARLRHQDRPFPPPCLAA